ncbi:hypothetical protein [Alkalihalophilus marmarensis]|uniref:Resolvase/invertase-type recombinase catalytic domain-containing protein n=1 Tax=Alkalihalophilus marmarensis DSM 21297 TaxID=1188261 RepID=U6SLV2_9BACI|nr:hypothetical protein [Alkalihalophilus marmarensis]ERN51621.1 hypothetical protein A33I_20015 [Alkalihalophilus marmarensis DSM 21297]
MVNSILIEVYTTLAQQERETLVQRQTEGISAAKAKGKHLGRPVKKLPEDWFDNYKQWRSGDLRTNDFISRVGMKRSTFYKKVREYESLRG